MPKSLTVWITIKGFGIVNKAEIDFLEISCFFNDPEDVGNLISGSSAFSKTSLRESLYCKVVKTLNSKGNQSWIFIGRIDAEAEATILWLPDAKCWKWKWSHSVMSDSLRTHESQHAKSSCPSPIPRVYPNSCPLSLWCHPTILSSVIPFSSFLQSFPTSGSFLMSWLFASKCRSFSFSISPFNEYSGLISFRVE